jgi:hypothetical protein
VVELKIIMRDDGSLNVNGPLANRLLCYGMLEAAKIEITKFSERSQSGLVVAPAGTALPKIE